MPITPEEERLLNSPVVNSSNNNTIQETIEEDVVCVWSGPRQTVLVKSESISSSATTNNAVAISSPAGNSYSLSPLVHALPQFATPMVVDQNTAPRVSTPIHIPDIAGIVAQSCNSSTTASITTAVPIISSIAGTSQLVHLMSVPIASSPARDQSARPSVPRTPVMPQLVPLQPQTTNSASQLPQVQQSTNLQTIAGSIANTSATAVSITQSCQPSGSSSAATRPSASQTINSSGSSTTQSNSAPHSASAPTSGVSTNAGQQNAQSRSTLGPIRHRQHRHILNDPWRQEPVRHDPPEIVRLGYRIQEEALSANIDLPEMAARDFLLYWRARNNEMRSSSFRHGRRRRF